VTDFLDEKYREIAARMAELQPLLDEYNRLLAAAEALAGVGGSPSAIQPPKAAVKRTPVSRRSSAASPDKAAKKTAAKSTKPAKSPAPVSEKPKARGTRASSRTAQTLELIQGQPGITIPELANAMGIQQSYLYRVLPGLQKDGKVEKRGRGWHMKGS
jgi:hypothetical protein